MRSWGSTRAGWEVEAHLPSGIPSFSIVGLADRGIASEENLRYLRRGGGQWIAGMRTRAGEPICEQALAHPGRYRQVRDNLRVKEVRVGSGDTARRFVVCHNPEEEAKDRARRERALERIKAELERIDRLRARSRREGTAHVRAECALRAHPSHARYLRQARAGACGSTAPPSARLDGKYLLETSDPEISAADVPLGYKNLLEAERCFRDLKGILRIQPVFHRLEERIRAHVLICWLALVLVRFAEHDDETSWREMRAET